MAPLSHRRKQNLRRFTSQKGAVVEWLHVWCRKSPEGREFKAWLCHATTGKLSVNPAVNTVNPLYNGIRYNGTIRNNVNPICTKISGSCILPLTVPCYSLRGHTFLGYLLESPRRGDSNKYTKRMIYKRTVKKYPLLMTGPYQVSL